MIGGGTHGRAALFASRLVLADAADAATLDELWDAWVAAGHPPVRATVQAGLAKGYRIELIVTAAADDS
jgi:enamine deaminase RidA (YjgF/YER057c/UK114 family)